MLPPNISLYLTYRCQLRCSHCYLTQSELLNKYTLDKSYAKSIVDDAVKHNVMMMIISGGDPLLHPDFFEIVTYIREKGILPLIAISGIDLTDDALANLKALNVPCVQVSLDGGSEKGNDTNRGPGSFHEIKKAVLRIQKYGIHANLAFCVHNKNLSELQQVLEFAHLNNIYRVKVNFWIPFRDSPTYGFRELTSEERMSVLKYCRETAIRLRQLDWIVVPGYDLNSCEPRTGGKYPPLTIGADGDISFGEFGEIIGNIRKDFPSQVYALAVSKLKLKSLIKIVNHHASMHNISEITELPENVFPHNGAIFRLDGKYSIMVKSQLPDFLRWFTVLHEIGHIATNTVAATPLQNRNPENERVTNLWALKEISPIVTKEFLDDAKKAAADEAGLYKLIAEKLEENTVNYWG